MFIIARGIVRGYLGIPLRPIQSAIAENCRSFCAAPASSEETVQAVVDKINDMFVEARDEIEYAQEEAGTTYFNDTYNGAKEMVDSVVTEFDGLLASLDDEQRGRLQRAMGMKIEQLKAELKQLDELHD